MTFHVILQGGHGVEVLVTEAAAIVWGAGSGNAVLDHQDLDLQIFSHMLQECEAPFI